jgi:hypothetical protein
MGFAGVEGPRICDIPDHESDGVAFPLFGDPLLGEIYRYWLSKRRDGALPRRADIKPGELGAPIRHLNLIDVIREPGQALKFRHRLMGTGIIEWLGMDFTGKMVDEHLYGPAAADILTSLTRIVTTAQPFHRLAPLDWNNRKFALTEAVELPLSGEAGEVAMILRGAVYRHTTDPNVKTLFEPLPLD